jgi:FAM183A and FAM183B related
MSKAEPLNEVARNAIWTEHCHRESRSLAMCEQFGGIRSPNKSALSPAVQRYGRCKQNSVTWCSYCNVLYIFVAAPKRGLSRIELLEHVACAVVVIPEKPNRTLPMSRPNAAEVAKAKATLDSMSIVKHEDATPEQLYVLPITANQDYGFYHKPLVKQEPLFCHPRGGCDVTHYADAYYTMTGTSPFARRDNLPSQ